MEEASATDVVLLDLDARTWEERLDRVESWLDNVLMTQTAFRVLAQDVRDKVHEPNVHGYLTDIAAQAEVHERRVDALYRLIGRTPSRARKVGGTVLGKARQALADVQGLAGGAHGNWRDLHQLLLASLNSLGAYGVAHQLGLALGHRELSEAALQVTSQKYRDHFLLQELVMELAPLAILYHRDF